MISSSSLPLKDLQALARRGYETRFGSEPRCVAAAPGRINLIGEHTDYNLGHVLPIAIERWCIVTAGPADGTLATVAASDHGELQVDLAAAVQRGEGGWGNYIRGAVRQFQDRGCRLPAFNAFIAGTVPVGSGLSSSAALCVSMATALEQMRGIRLDPRDKALLCQRIEHEFAGVPCGLMDQTASIMARSGCALHLDCRDGVIEHVPMPSPDQAVLLVIDTGVRHDLATNEYSLRRAQCAQAVAAIAALTGRSIISLREVDEATLSQCKSQLDPLLLKRARHVVTENGRVLAAVAALRRGDLQTFGQLMYASHDSLRDDYDVSCDELDAVVESARSIGLTGGVLGTRMTGGGFGGCAIALCEPHRRDQIEKNIAAAFASRFGREPGMFATVAAGGAEEVSDGMMG